MALSDPNDTLAYQGSRVLCQSRNMSDVPCASVAKAMKAYMAADIKGKHTLPENEALWFYGLNHGVKLIADKRDKLEPLDAWELDFVKTYHEKMTKKSVRAFYYLLWICIRESRHCKTMSLTAQGAADKVGHGVFAQWMSSAGGEDGISTRFLNHPPSMPIGPFCEAISHMFYKGSYNGNFGGKKWGVTTDCLVNFVTGKTSAEIMLDTVWTLCHNGGPIFDKGHFYAHHSGYLIRILDVQRAGQVPEGVLFDKLISQYSDNALGNCMVELRARFSEVIGNYVDWFKVEELGAVQSYSNEKAKLKANCMSPEEKKALAEKALAAAEAAVKAKAEHAKHYFEIMSGLEVKKILREAA